MEIDIYQTSKPSIFCCILEKLKAISSAFCAAEFTTLNTSAGVTKIETRWNSISTFTAYFNMATILGISFRLLSYILCLYNVYQTSHQYNGSIIENFEIIKSDPIYQLPIYRVAPFSCRILLPSFLPNHQRLQIQIWHLLDG